MQLNEKDLALVYTRSSGSCLKIHKNKHLMLTGEIRLVSLAQSWTWRYRSISCSDGRKCEFLRNLLSTYWLDKDVMKS